ncbi:MAG TPA: hypothetical protein VL688_06235 [Verrucomicrobiae bacterium]|jgi:hypothetical protein|nr:hypothetical protein [Verrucomicrobiae bacterium]
MKTVPSAAPQKKSSPRFLMAGLALLGLACASMATAPDLRAQEAEREPVTISVVVSNPSKEKTQTIPVKIDLPKEITPSEIVENEGLQVQYDDQRSIYFLYNSKVELKPKQTRVFNVQVKDVWFIPKSALAEVGSEAQRLLARLKGTEYYDSGKRLYDLIGEKVAGIEAKQNDETLGQKQRIGAYRLNLLAMEEIKQLLEKMEKILTVTGGVPTPNIPEKLKSDAPSAKTTWMIIFAILIFVGSVGLVFFVTWYRKAAAEKTVRDESQGAMPGDLPGEDVRNRVA